MIPTQHLCYLALFAFASLLDFFVLLIFVVPFALLHLSSFICLLIRTKSFVSLHGPFYGYWWCPAVRVSFFICLLHVTGVSGAFGGVQLIGSLSFLPLHWFFGVSGGVCLALCIFLSLRSSVFLHCLPSYVSLHCALPSCVSPRCFLASLVFLVLLAVSAIVIFLHVSSFIVVSLHCCLALSVLLVFLAVSGAVVFPSLLSLFLLWLPFTIVPLRCGLLSLWSPFINPFAWRLPPYVFLSGAVRLCCLASFVFSFVSNAAASVTQKRRLCSICFAPRFIKFGAGGGKGVPKNHA